MSVFDLTEARPISAARRIGPVKLLVDSSGIGGIERHVEVLTRGLRGAGIDAQVLLLADHGRNPWLAQLEASGAPFDVVAGGLLGLAARLRRDDVAILHTHGYKAGIVGRCAALMTRTPVVSTFHAGERAAFPVSLYQRIDEWTAFLASRISVSRPIAAQLPFASEIIANFIDTPSAPPVAQLRNGISFVGRLSIEKGPDIFCRVASACADAGVWRVFGDGPMRAELEARHAGVVSFEGMVEDIGRAWRQTGLLVISSRAEGLPMVAIEALAAGVPVAAARVGALPEVISHGENGWLFEPGDEAALARIVAHWAQHRHALHPRWSEAAWRCARERFGLEAGLRRTLDVYRRAGGD